jgi:hypothetical protein
MAFFRKPTRPVTDSEVEKLDQLLLRFGAELVNADDATLDAVVSRWPAGQFKTVAKAQHAVAKAFQRHLTGLEAKRDEALKALGI